MKYFLFLIPLLLNAQNLILFRDDSFNPSQIPPTTLYLWLDASDETTVTRYSTSDSVSSWADKSTNSFDVTQNTGANMPRAIIANQNGLQTIAFDGSNDILANSSFQFPNAFTVFIAYKDRTGTNGSMIADAAGKLLLRNTDIFQNTDAGAVTISTALNDMNIVVLEFNYTTDVYRVYSDVGVLIGVSITACANTLTSLQVGRNFQFSEYFNGKLCEIIFLNGTVFSTYGLKVINYLNDKWAF